MFRYTIIDVGDDLVVFNKNDGALAPSKRDSWPPRFPTEEELKYDRLRLKSEKIERMRRLEEDVRERRVQSVNANFKNSAADQEAEEEEADKTERSSQDSGIVSFREDEMRSNTEDKKEEEEESVVPVTPSPVQSSVRSVSVSIKSSNSVKSKVSVKNRSKSCGSRTTPHTSPVVPDDVNAGPGDKPYIVAPGRKRTPKPHKKSGGCCVIL